MSTTTLLPASLWPVEFVRLIAFPATPKCADAQQWWQDLTGNPPAVSQPIPGGQGRDDRGPHQGATLILTAEPNRIVWEVRSPAAVDESGNFPTIGPFREKSDWLVQFLTPWLATSCPPLLRLAFSAKLLQLVPNSKEAFELLSACLPMVSLKSNPNDFLLQINTRKNSHVAHGWPINRVRCWSKMNVAIFVEPGKPFTWPDRCYSALELDINTAPEKAELLASNLLPGLFGELENLGIEIAQQGETI